MPTNVSLEYSGAEAKYHQAKTTKEKITALEEMIRYAPKHKGGENLCRELKKRLAKLKKESKAKKASKKPAFVLKKEGAARVCLVGIPNSGKSSLLNCLTNAHAGVADYPYTTVMPEVGALDFNELKIQVVEIPATLSPEFLSIAKDSELIVFVIDSTKNFEMQKSYLLKKMAEFRISTKAIFVCNKKDIGIDCTNCLNVSAETKENVEALKKEIYSNLGIIRVFTKHRGEIQHPPMVMKVGATVESVALKIHKDFVEGFKYAAIWGPSAKFPGEKVGLAHVLKDGDVVEVHTR